MLNVEIRKSRTYWDISDLINAQLRNLDPETAHWAAVGSLKYMLGPVYTMSLREPEEGSMEKAFRLKTTVWGKNLAHPLGLAAGFDKNGEVIDELLEMGFR
jgi:dihydroorotate dehydrogenase